jgi:hypothetical protein
MGDCTLAVHARRSLTGALGGQGEGLAGAERSQMTSRVVRAVYLVAAVTVLACERDSREPNVLTPPLHDGPCAEVYAAGLVVEVRDAITGEPAAHDSVGVIQDGTYRETLQIEASVDPLSALRLVGAWERTGVYSVVIRKEGYRDWSTTAVVEADTCHVHTVTLQAMLEGVS